MVSTILKNTPVSGHRLSSVVPGEVTGEAKDRELTNLDLALKLHYVRGVYFFRSEAVQGLTINDLKEPMFPWLALYPTTSGRIRRSQATGRPFIKCNDGGVRIVEAECDQTLEEWLAANDHQYSLDSFLVHHQVLGPDLGFSPLVFIQLTWFKCGGICIGLSWSHVLGDPFSASAFMNSWGQIMEGHVPSTPLQVPNHKVPKNPPSQTPRKPSSPKQVEPVGDHWVTANNCKMETLSIHFTAKQLDNIVSDDCGGLDRVANISQFHLLSAIIWKSLSKVRGDSGPRTVTICARNSPPSEHEDPRNDVVFSVVRADFSVAKCGVYELAELIAEKQEEEDGLIEEMMMGDQDGKLEDYIVYGANLTFVNLEGANVYGLELKGHKPAQASYTIEGVGDEGAVLVLPGPESGSKSSDAGRTVTLILPENQLTKLTNELREKIGVSVN
ncbi:hypothetical protein Tsubulata_001944 [Turnera subulata]|uniref:Uncharacterized protein n=1 Tax=Turnera subulata TaxID=218843 RepID=A0A9Q0FJZ1_9ROSI|nr:hypothetical protein Tsubulata_001944 [Turnera subulata]